MFHEKCSINKVRFDWIYAHHTGRHSIWRNELVLQVSHTMYTTHVHWTEILQLLLNITITYIHQCNPISSLNLTFCPVHLQELIRAVTLSPWLHSSLLKKPSPSKAHWSIITWLSAVEQEQRVQKSRSRIEKFVTESVRKSLSEAIKAHERRSAPRWVQVPAAWLIWICLALSLLLHGQWADYKAEQLLCVSYRGHEAEQRINDSEFCNTKFTLRSVEKGGY